LEMGTFFIADVAGRPSGARRAEMGMCREASHLLLLLCGSGLEREL